jgi:hypothetical protein
MAAVTDLADLLADAAERPFDHGEAMAQTTVVSSAEVVAGVRAAPGHRRDEPIAPALVVDRLVAAVEPALVASTGPRCLAP